jgi:hypothetical protein
MPMNSRNRHQWTNIEDKKLMDLYKQNKSYIEIASELGRTEDAIKARFVKIEIVKKYDINKPFENQGRKICRKYDINPDDLMRYLKYSKLKIINDYNEDSDDYNSDENDSNYDIVYNLKIIGRKISIIGTTFILYAGYRIITHLISKY